MGEGAAAMNWPADTSPPEQDTAVPVPGECGVPSVTGLPASNGEARRPADVARKPSHARDGAGQELDELVVSRLLATGLDLHAALRQLGDHRAAADIHHAIGELDQVIRDIRDAVFHPPRRPLTRETTVESPAGE
jgi:hypothetical protein